MPLFQKKPSSLVRAANEKRREVAYSLYERQEQDEHNCRIIIAYLSAIEKKYLTEKDYLILVNSYNNLGMILNNDESRSYFMEGLSLLTSSTKLLNKTEGQLYLASLKTNIASTEENREEALSLYYSAERIFAQEIDNLSSVYLMYYSKVCFEKIRHIDGNESDKKALLNKAIELIFSTPTTQITEKNWLIYVFYLDTFCSLEDNLDIVWEKLRQLFVAFQHIQIDKLSEKNYNILQRAFYRLYDIPGYTDEKITFIMVLKDRLESIAEKNLGIKRCLSMCLNAIGLLSRENRDKVKWYGQALSMFIDTITSSTEEERDEYEDIISFKNIIYNACCYVDDKDKLSIISRTIDNLFDKIKDKNVSDYFDIMKEILFYANKIKSFDNHLENHTLWYNAVIDKMVGRLNEINYPYKNNELKELANFYHHLGQLDLLSKKNKFKFLHKTIDILSGLVDENKNILLADIYMEMKEKKEKPIYLIKALEVLNEVSESEDVISRKGEIYYALSVYAEKDKINIDGELIDQLDCINRAIQELDSMPIDSHTVTTLKILQHCHRKIKSDQSVLLKLQKKIISIDKQAPSYRGLAEIYYSLYFHEKSLEKANTYIHKTLSAYLLIKEQERNINDWFEIANNYQLLALHAKNIHRYEEANQFFNAALKAYNRSAQLVRLDQLAKLNPSTQVVVSQEEEIKNNARVNSIINVVRGLRELDLPLSICPQIYDLIDFNQAPTPDFAYLCKIHFNVMNNYSPHHSAPLLTLIQFMETIELELEINPNAFASFGASIIENKETFIEKLNALRVKHAPLSLLKSLDEAPVTTVALTVKVAELENLVEKLREELAKSSQNIHLLFARHNVSREEHPVEFRPQTPMLSS